MHIGWDLATKLCGWCAGDGSRLPVAGAFRLEQREVLGDLGVEFKTHVLNLHRRFPADRWFVEQPLISPHDARWTLERIYGVTFLLHTLGHTLGIPVEAVPQDTAKKEWGGKHQLRGKGVDRETRQRAGKKLMVDTCERLGIAIPLTERAGRFDAADACGIWKVGLRLSKSPHLQRWDAAVYRGRGALL